MAIRVPGRNVVGDQVMESVTNANSREEQVMRVGGTFPIPAVTGTITTATGTVTATDVSHAGTLLVQIYGTHAGVNVIFEILDSAGGNTNWVPIAGARVDGVGGAQFTSGVLPANSSTAWRFPIGRASQFRVRATQWTSGTANVIIDPAVPWGEPVINAITQPTGKNVYFASMAALYTTATLTAAAVNQIGYIFHPAAATPRYELRHIFLWIPVMGTAGNFRMVLQRITAEAGTPGGTLQTVAPVDPLDAASSAVVRTNGPAAPTAAGNPLTLSFHNNAVANQIAGQPLDILNLLAQDQGMKLPAMRSGVAEGWALQLIVGTALTTAPQTFATFVWAEI